MLMSLLLLPKQLLLTTNCTQCYWQCGMQKASEGFIVFSILSTNCRHDDRVGFESMLLKIATRPHATWLHAALGQAGVACAAAGRMHLAWSAKPTSHTPHPAVSVQMPQPAAGQAVLNVSLILGPSNNFTISYFAPASAANSVARGCGTDPTNKTYCLLIGKYNASASTPRKQVRCEPGRHVATLSCTPRAKRSAGSHLNQAADAGRAAGYAAQGARLCGSEFHVMPHALGMPVTACWGRCAQVFDRGGDFCDQNKTRRYTTYVAWVCFPGLRQDKLVPVYFNCEG